MQSGPPSEGENRRYKHYGVPKLRNHVIQRLAEAYSNNELELTEYERRVKLAHEAQTVEELQSLLEDFTDQEVRLSDTYQVVSKTGRLFITLIGDREVFADDFIENKITILTALGDLTIDLSSIESKKNIYNITNISLIGDTRVIIPPNVDLVRHVFTLIGDFKRKRRRETKTVDKDCKVILRGLKLLGDVVIIERDSLNV